MLSVELCWVLSDVVVQRSFSHNYVGVLVWLGCVNESILVPFVAPPRFFCLRKPDQQFNAHFHTHICGDGLCQQINGGPVRHPSGIFLLQKNPINNSTLIFTHTCGGMGLDGLGQQINASPVRHPSQIFWPQKNPINNSMLIFTHTYGGIGVDGFSQQINASPVWHPSLIFLPKKNPINNSTLKFTYTCWVIGPDGLSSFVNIYT